MVYILYTCINLLPGGRGGAEQLAHANAYKSGPNRSCRPASQGQPRKLQARARARGIAHFFLFANMPPHAQEKASPRLQAVQDIKELLDKPPTLPKGTKNGKILSILSQKNTHNKDPWELLNSHCEVLWGGNLQDKCTGRLPNIKTGRYELHGFINYLKCVVGKSQLNKVHGSILRVCLLFNLSALHLSHVYTRDLPPVMKPQSRKKMPAKTKPMDPTLDAQEKVRDVGKGTLAGYLYPQTGTSIELSLHLRSALTVFERSITGRLNEGQVVQATLFSSC